MEKEFIIGYIFIFYLFLNTLLISGCGGGGGSQATNVSCSPSFIEDYNYINGTIYLLPGETVNIPMGLWGQTLSCTLILPDFF